ncbi:hypothetical protein HM1_1127 [Heliomicrobium modesticaldum Ice1]|uniref:Uncharacterized protein n=1 Tax=Heliobacterium modesticaldum (strain ATCC 51547 / Ice1) TaxID=498761 RepID=B0THK9_HELMI|nr:hypothetical protein HM1_1127 [Heliomicrobium modesticaldum Ice1]
MAVAGLGGEDEIFLIGQTSSPLSNTVKNRCQYIRQKE